MAYTSSTFATFSSSAHFMGRKVSVKEHSSPQTRVHFRPLRVSAACTSTAEITVSHIASPSSLYEILGIQVGATCQEIKASYRRLARVLHPDVSANGQNNAATAHEFIKVHEAYATLSDPEKRADYDRTLMFRRSFAVSVSAAPMASSMSSRFSGYTGRSWETDQCW